MSYGTMVCCGVSCCCTVMIILVGFFLAVILYNELHFYKVSFDYGYNEDTMEDLDMDEVEERLPFLKEQWQKNYWIKNWDDSRIDEVTSYVNSTYEEEDTIWSTGFSCTGRLDSVFYQVPEANFTDWNTLLSTKDEFDEMKDVFEDYCRHISKDETYQEVFGQKWWKDENETISEHNTDILEDEDYTPEDDDEDILIKNLPWYMPKQNFDKRQARRNKTSEVFKCCRMRVYYPETDKALDDRLPLVASMTVHIESDLERYLVDRTNETLKLFGLRQNSDDYMTVQDESIVLPPSEFWWYADHENFGPNNLKSMYDYDPADDQPDEQMWNKGY